MGAELAVVPYNAMLPDITPRERLGRWSGWAWGLGYAGGLAALLLALFGVINPDAWLDLPRDDASHVRATFVLVALWYGIFALPLLLLTPDLAVKSITPRRALRRGLGQLLESVRQVRKYSHLVRFLIARLFFIDGLATIFAFGGIYAAGSFGFDEREVLLFGIALNVSTGIGAVAFAWLDDLLGSRTVILISILGVLVPAAAILLIDSTLVFWLLGLFMGLWSGTSCEPFLHGTGGTAGMADPVFRSAHLFRQGHGISRSAAGGLGHRVVRQPARGHDRDPGTAADRAGTDVDGATQPEGQGAWRFSAVTVPPAPAAPG